MRDGRNFNRGYINALWQWRKVKTSTDTVGQSLEKEFLVDDTAITTTYISRKLDALEKMVRKGSVAGCNVSKTFPSKDTPKTKWLNAARDGLSKNSKKLTNINSSNGKKLTTECISNKTVEQVPVKLNNETVALENEQRRTQPELRSRVAIKNDIHSKSEDLPSNDKNLSIQQRKIIVKLTEQISGLEGKQTLVNNEIDSIKMLLKDFMKNQALQDDDSHVTDQSVDDPEPNRSKGKKK